MARLMSWTKDSNRVSSCVMSWRLLSAIAACEASDSARRWSCAVKARTWPVAGSVALMSCSTPMSSFSWFFIGTVRNDCER